MSDHCPWSGSPCELFGRDYAAIVGIWPGDVFDKAKAKAFIPVAQVKGALGCVYCKFSGIKVAGMLLDALYQT